MEAVREENANLLEEIQQLQKAREVAEQQRDEATDALRFQKQQGATSDSELEREVERLRSELKSTIQAADGAEARAREVEKELGDVTVELRRRNEAAEL